MLMGCGSEKVSDILKVETSYLIEATELKEMITRPNIKLLDFRKPKDYIKGHIVNAVNIWRSDIDDDSYNYKGMMSKKGQIETLFGNLGIGSNDTIVVYDDNGLCNAARLWWILQNYDFNQVKLLHGGMPAWQLIGGEVTNIVPGFAKTDFYLPQNPSMKYHFSKDDMQSILQTGAIILDTRTADEFSGKRQKKGASKGGRIPGGIHIDWAEAIDFNGDKRIKSEEDLLSIYGTLTSDKNEMIIIYCHTGVRSAHTTFVLTQLMGYDNVKNYDGSWTEWSHFEDHPYEQDSLTKIFK
ncbi:MAG: thiosulfate/3-mercaptopyruvate sulfurtransferase [Gammaproteobacteria bacterium]|jgi:thiosulfate/3-mercaptopyruvate sulfurtransferase